MLRNRTKFRLINRPLPAVVVPKKILGIMIWIVCAFGVLQAGVGVTAAAATSLKPIDRTALQNILDTTAKELMVPGAMVLLRTAQGEFIVSYGTTRAGCRDPSTCRYALQDRLEYQDDDGCRDYAVGAGRKIRD